MNDVLTYTIKARNVWAEIRAGRVLGLLGTQPTFRPFGTALLGYPFGYNDDFRAFYWRTVALPACFAALGAFAAALAAGATWRCPSAWLLACLCGMMPMWWAFDAGWAPGEGKQALRLMPMWWAFDHAGGNGLPRWGMMDAPQAGVAAFATGLLMLGWRRNSLCVTFAGCVLSALTLLIKPVGVFLIAGHTFAAGCFWACSLQKTETKGWRRFAAGALLGAAFCALLCAVCYFSPYFSEANREFGRQTLDQLKTFHREDIISASMGLIPLLGMLGFGLVTVAMWTASLFRIRRWIQARPWLIAACVVAVLVFFFQLATLYHGTRFLIPRYFVPALATFWILISPLLWLLLVESRLARFFVLLNAVVLSASVWFPEFARDWHTKTGYATFTDGEAAAAYELAHSALDKSELLSHEPIVFLLGDYGYAEGLIARQIALAGPWEDTVVWAYYPRIYETHRPVVHPCDIAISDFVITDSREFLTHKNETLGNIELLLATESGESLAPVIAADNGLAIRKIADPIELEKAIASRLVAEGLLHPEESGPVLLDVAPTPLATWDSGDVLCSAKAEWAGGKLRVISTWSGTRRDKRDLRMTVVLVDHAGSQIRRIDCSLIPPPSAAGGKAYRRTFVDELDCGRFRGRTASVAIGIYDRPASSNVRARTQDSPRARAWVPLPISAGSP